MRRTLLVLSLLSIGSSLPARADAPHTAPPSTAPPTPPPAPWRDLYHQGSVAYDAGRLDEALSDFTQSFDRGGPPTVLYDIALTLDRMGRTADAIAAYHRYLDAAPDASNRDIVEARLVELTPSASTSARVASPSAPILSLVTPDAPRTTSADGAYLATHARPTGDHWEPQGPEWVASWVMLALTAATTVATVLVWNDGVGHFRQLRDLCASPVGCTATDISDSSAHTSQDVTNALLGVSIGLGAVTVLTFILEGVVSGNRMHFVRGGAPRQTPGPQLSIGLTGLSISGTF